MFVACHPDSREPLGFAFIAFGNLDDVTSAIQGRRFVVIDKHVIDIRREQPCPSPLLEKCRHLLPASGLQGAGRNASPVSVDQVNTPTSLSTAKSAVSAAGVPRWSDDTPAATDLVRGGHSVTQATPAATRHFSGSEHAAGETPASSEESRVRRLPVKKWTTADLCWWLEHKLELGEAVTVIQSQLQFQHVTGYDLATLNAAEIVELLLRLDVWPHHRKKILRCLQVELSRPVTTGLVREEVPGATNWVKRVSSSASVASLEDKTRTPSLVRRGARLSERLEERAASQSLLPKELDLERAASAPPKAPIGGDLTYAAAAGGRSPSPEETQIQPPVGDYGRESDRLAAKAPVGAVAQTAAARKNFRRRQKRRQGSEKTALSYLARSIAGVPNGTEGIENDGRKPVQRDTSLGGETSSTTSADATTYYHGGQYRALPGRTVYTDMGGSREERVVVAEDVELRREVVLKFFRSKKEFDHEEEVMQTVGPQHAPEVFSKFIHDLRTGESKMLRPAKGASGGAGGTDLPDAPSPLRRMTSQESSGSVGSSRVAPSSSQRWVLVMEAADNDGMSLAEYVRQVDISDMEARFIARRVLDSVWHLHQFGYVHCDIKPSHFLQFKGLWKLIDYGSAVRERSRAIPGYTHRYCPPEVARAVLKRHMLSPHPSPMRGTLRTPDRTSVGRAGAEPDELMLAPPALPGSAGLSGSPGIADVARTLGGSMEPGGFSFGHQRTRVAASFAQGRNRALAKRPVGSEHMGAVNGERKAVFAGFSGTTTGKPSTPWVRPGGTPSSSPRTSAASGRQRASKSPPTPPHGAAGELRTDVSTGAWSSASRSAAAGFSQHTPFGEMGAHAPIKLERSLDMWCVGLTLYEVFAGACYFDEDVELDHIACGSELMMAMPAARSAGSAAQQNGGSPPRPRTKKLPEAESGAQNGTDEGEWCVVPRKRKSKPRRKQRAHHRRKRSGHSLIGFVSVGAAGGKEVLPASAHYAGSDDARGVSVVEGHPERIEEPGAMAAAVRPAARSAPQVPLAPTGHQRHQPHPLRPQPLRVLTKAQRRFIQFMVQKDPRKRLSASAMLLKSYVTPKEATNEAVRLLVLALFSSPSFFKGYRVTQLQLMREVKALLRCVPVRDWTVLPACRFPIDVQAALSQCSPRIIQFSGHGDAYSSGPLAGSLAFEDARGEVDVPTADQLVSVLSATSVECVFLNACSTRTLGERIVGKMPGVWVICWESKLHDDAAQKFSSNFYRRMAACQGEPDCFERAFQLAKRDTFERSEFREGKPEGWLHEFQSPDHEHRRRGTIDETCNGCNPPVHGVVVLLGGSGRVATRAPATARARRRRSKAGMS